MGRHAGMACPPRAAGALNAEVGGGPRTRGGEWCIRRVEEHFQAREPEQFLSGTLHPVVYRKHSSSTIHFSILARSGLFLCQNEYVELKGGTRV